MERLTWEGFVADNGMRESFESKSDPNPSQHEYVPGQTKTGDGAMVVYLVYTRSPTHCIGCCSVLRSTKYVGSNKLRGA